MRRKGLVLLVVVLAALAAWRFFPRGGNGGECPSFLPEVNRMIGLRFDPSYFYDRGMTARELARELVPAWKSAGINTVFFRVYDPQYGASYRTSLAYNHETDYGRQDLLRHLLDEAHARGMKVIAWLPMLNHRGLWEAKPEWRALRAGGEPYRAESMAFPLCARHPGARQWWRKFVEDLLDRYGALDGIDCAEPCVSWREDEACHCSVCATGFANGGKEAAGSWSRFRAQPLTALIGETIACARARGKTAVVTAVIPSGQDGAVLPFDVLRDRTGLDLDAVLSAPDKPDVFSCELMWQEWAGVFGNAALFGPEWVQGAFAQVRARAGGRARLVAHLEISDFGSVVVTPGELGASLAAALRAGAEGVEVYDAALLEKKNGWAAFKDLAAIKARTRILIVHDSDNLSDVRQLATMCGHFETEVELKASAAYAEGDSRDFDALFYIGVEPRAAVPPAFLRDVAARDGTVMWLGYNIEKLLAATSRYGIVHVETRRDGAFTRVRYRGTELVRGEPVLNIVQVADGAKVQVLAEALSGDASVPYAVRSGRFWYFADNPMSFAVEGGNYLALADLLHDIIGEDHVPTRIGLVRIEDVHPLTPPGRITTAARMLQSRGIPFLIALVPYYTFPEEGTFIAMHERPEFVAAIKDAVARGATVVLHGVTHQRVGETTADYEFWDTTRDGPIEGRTDARVRARLARGIEECIRSGVYPLLWETPHYAASLADYRVVSEVFSTACERRQSADMIGSDQLYPYTIVRDLFGQMIIPENLGYVPLEAQSAEPVLAAAARNLVVRDAVSGFFFHLFCELGTLGEIADGMLAQGYRFPDVRTLPLAVAGPRFSVASTAAPPGGGKELPHAMLLDRRGRVVWSGARRDYPAEKETVPGIRVSMADDLLAAVASADARAGGRQAFFARPLAVGIMASAPEFETIANVFRAVAVPCTRLDPETGVVGLSPAVTLLVVSEDAAAMSAFRPQLLNFAAKGGVLITWGRSPLALELGLTFDRAPVEAAEIEDLNYMFSLPLPRPAAIPNVRCGERHEVLMRARPSMAPCLILVPWDDGMVFYSALPPWGEGAWAPYPYLLSILRDQCMQAPALRVKNVEIYFDPGLRENIAVEDLVKHWARNGVRVIHAGAWHEYAEWTYEYDRLIELAHQNGMLVHAWLALPLVSQKFWDEHPAWREKNPRGEDVHVDWRIAVALADPGCLAAVQAWIDDLLRRLAFDGVTLAGLHFGGEGPERPESLSPFGGAACEDFARKHGFDPRELFAGGAHDWARSPGDLARFWAWRKDLTTAIHRELLGTLAAHGKERPLALRVALLDGRAMPEKAELLGVDVDAILALRAAVPFDVQFLDSGAVRPRGRARVQALLRDYASHVAPADMTMHINLAEAGAGTGMGALTGLALYREIAEAAPFPVAIYSEESIPDADWPLLACAAAAGAEIAFGAEEVAVKSPRGVRVAYAGARGFAPFLNGVRWPGRDAAEVIVPPGEHRVTLASGGSAAGAEIVDLSCDLLDAAPIPRGVRFAYRSKERACVVLSRAPVELAVDGAGQAAPASEGLRGVPLLLPPGEHTVVAIAESRTAFAFRVGSIILSSGIVGLGVISLVMIGLVFIVGRLRSRAQRAHGPASGGEGI